MFDRHFNVGEDPPRDFDLDAATLGCELFSGFMGHHGTAALSSCLWSIFHIISHYIMYPLVI